LQKLTRIPDNIVLLDASPIKHTVMPLKELKNVFLES